MRPVPRPWWKVIAFLALTALLTWALPWQRIPLPGFVRAVLLSTETGATVMRDGVQLPPESAVVVALA